MNTKSIIRILFSQTRLTVALAAFFTVAVADIVPRPRPPAPPTPPVPPPILRVTLRDNEKPMEIASYAVDARVNGPVATVSTTLSFRNPNGRVLDVSLGAEFCVAGSISFLSELSKIVPQATTTFRPSDKVYLAPREPRPWEQ